MRNWLIFLLLFPVTSHTVMGNSEIQFQLDHFSPKDSLSLDSLWQTLVFEKGGCLTGGQRVINGKFGGERCVLTNDPRVNWEPFFMHPKKELTEFLIAKFTDTTTTNIHTCPFYTATNGEVAVYCLTKIYLVNWYDFEPFLAYRDRQTTGGDDSEQTWLQAILADSKQRALLVEEWRKL